MTLRIEKKLLFTHNNDHPNVINWSGHRLAGTAVHRTRWELHKWKFFLSSNINNEALPIQEYMAITNSSSGNNRDMKLNFEGPANT